MQRQPPSLRRRGKRSGKRIAIGRFGYHLGYHLGYRYDIGETR